MSKYAVVTCSSYHYLLGLNALLNGLDYYEIKDIDVHVASEPKLKPYFDYIKDKFNFPIYYHSALELCGHDVVPPNPAINPYYRDTDFVWAKYPLTKLIMDNYDAILQIDADCMVVSDINKYFDIAAKTGFILCPKSPQSGMFLEDIAAYPKDKLKEYLGSMPIKNYILFWDAKKHEDLIDYVWDLRESPLLLKNSGLETAFFVDAIYKLNKFSVLLELPGSLWIADNYAHKSSVYLGGQKKYRLVNPFGDQIAIMHGRYWNYSMSKTILKKTDQNFNHGIDYINLKNNILSHQTLIDFFNMKYKVTLQQIKELDPFYKHITDLSEV